MALITDATTVALSGLAHIDPLLDSGPGWNWLTPTRNTIRYTFSVTSGNETGNSGISGGVTAFNATQQSACISQLAYISQLTGIKFVATSIGTEADLHFAATDLVPDGSIAGLCSWGQSWSYDSNKTIISYSAQAYVYLDNVEWNRDNSNPTAGSSGYETLLHEIGHALGLKHPFDGDITLPRTEDNTANSLMSYTPSGGPYSTFSPYDIAALMWLYGGDGLGGKLGVSTSGRYLMGSTKDETVNGGSGNDYLDGQSGSDSLLGGAGDDVLVGGAGNDTAVYTANQSNYVITVVGSGYSVKSAAEGTDSLSSIEFLKFADQTVSLSSLDTTPPVVTALSPLDKSKDVAPTTDLVITFSESIARGTGNIVLKTAAGTVIATYAAATSSNLTIAGNLLTINPTLDLSTATEYRVEIASGTVKDLSGNSYAGSGTYSFTTKVSAPANQVVVGTSANDLLTTSPANDSIDGAAGIDTVVYTGTRADHTLTQTSAGWTISSTADGTDTLSNIERLKFADTTVALDISGVAGQAYRIYQAALDRTPDPTGLGYWISVMDSGSTLQSVAQGFVSSPEFIGLYGTNPSNAQIVTRLYTNVLHRAPDQSGFDYWLGVLDRQDATVAEVLASFGESPENQAALIGAISSGIAFIPYVG